MTHKLGDKIPTALVRNPENRSKVLPEITPGCEWVFDGEGVATRKYDGTCIMVDENEKWWARREVKPGKTAPENYVPIAFDEVTGKTQGWEPIEQSPFYKPFLDAVDLHPSVQYTVGTYELMGPKINGNPEGWSKHEIRLHAWAPEIPDLNGVRGIDHIMRVIALMKESLGYEGVVWHHPDGRMAKLKGRDIPYE